MEEYTSLDTFRPHMRSDIILGPPWLSKERIVHYLKDTATERYYRIGEKEDFLLRRMDGARTLQEIGVEYEATFKHHLSPLAWKQIMALLRERHLLTPVSSSSSATTLIQHVPGQKYIIDQSEHQQRLILFSPDRLLSKLIPLAKFAFQPAFIAVALLIIMMLEVFVVCHSAKLVTEITEDFTSYFQFPFGLVFIALLWLFFLVHELAHGLTCKYFGGSVQEIGIMRQFCYFFPYCKIDDVLLFYNRWHRVYTAIAGIFINLLMLFPFAILWWLTSELGLIAYTPLRVISTFALIIINGIILSNLLPFFGSDGYLIFRYASNTIDISQEESAIFREKHLSILYSISRNVYEILYKIGSVFLWLVIILMVFKREGGDFLLPFTSIILAYYALPFMLFVLATISRNVRNMIHGRCFS